MRYWEHLKRGGNLLEFRPNRRLLFRKRYSDKLQMISPGAPCGQSRACIALYGSVDLPENLPPLPKWGVTTLPNIQLGTFQSAKPYRVKDAQIITNTFDE